MKNKSFQPIAILSVVVLNRTLKNSTHMIRFLLRYRKNYYNESTLLPTKLIKIATEKFLESATNKENFTKLIMV